MSRVVVDWAKERKAGTLALGDVRDVADGKRLGAKSQQQIGLWSHGKVRDDLTYKATAEGIYKATAEGIYKATAEGIALALVDAHLTATTCPACGHQYKPRARVYRCPTCGLVAHQEVVSSVTILSRKVHGEVGCFLPPPLAATM